MASIVQGKTQCRLCGKTIEVPGDMVAFPAFVPKGHFYSSYSDSAYHRECFDDWEHRAVFVKLYDAYRAVWDSRPVGMAYEEAEQWFKERLEKVFATETSEF